MEELNCQQTQLPPSPAGGPCVALWLSSTMQGGVQKEGLEEDVGRRVQNMDLESEGSRFKSRLKQLKAPKQFT